MKKIKYYLKKGGKSKFFKHVRKRKKRYILLLGLLIIPFLSFQTLCPLVSDVPDSFSFTTTIHETNSLYGIDDYTRTEDSSYLTFPEWYTVFSYQEYASHMSQGNPPSDFPYFSAVGQYWGSYCSGHVITKNNYPTNYQNHIMLSTIGVSFSAEYIIKGIYENTIGRITQIFGYDSQEDLLMVDSAVEFGEFIPFDPWYDFPYGAKMGEMWTEPSLFGWDFIRKWERKTMVTIANSVRVLYAGVIRFATKSTYGAPTEVIHLKVSSISDDLINTNPDINLIKDLGESKIITMPHYQGFTDTLPSLVEDGVQIQDIAGNDEIVFSLIAPSNWKYQLDDGQVIFEMRVLIDDDLKRLAVKLPVDELHTILPQLEDEGIIIEHVFDY